MRIELLSMWHGTSSMVLIRAHWFW